MTRILTVQDLSCVGQCSLTAALPIISACGIECAVLPSAVLSTHTGFSQWTFHDMTDQMRSIGAHWEKEGLTFEALYVGYLGRMGAVKCIRELKQRILTNSARIFLDPAMADHGRLYSGLDQPYVEEMKALVSDADFLLPNLTEACLLADRPFYDNMSWQEIVETVAALDSLGAKTVVLTGVSPHPENTGVLIADAKGIRSMEHPRLEHGSYGTGDVFASAFVGSIMRGKTADEAAEIASRFTFSALETTQQDPAHWYGVCFEKQIGQLVEMVNR